MVGGELHLQLTGENVDDTTLQSLSNERSRTIRQEQIGDACPAEGVSVRGGKGDPITIGAIVLALVGSGGVVGKLVDVLKSYVERRPQLKFEFAKSDGSRLLIDAQGLAREQIDNTHRLIDEFLRN